MGFDEASTIPLGLGTAAMGLFTPDVRPRRDFNSVGLTAPWEEGGRGKYAGNPIVIFGGAGSVGQYGMSNLSNRTVRTLMSIQSFNLRSSPAFHQS